MKEMLIMIEVAGRKCALKASDIETVIDIDTVTPIPRAPAHIVGLSALRSQALTVLDSRIIVGADSDAFPTDHRGVVISVDGYSYTMMVDRVGDVATMLSEPEHITGGFGKNWQEFSLGMVETDTGPALLLSKEMIVRHCKKQLM